MFTCKTETFDKLIYLCYVVQGIYTCKTGNLVMNLNYFTCAVVEGMYKCMTVQYGNEPLRFYLCCCTGYVHIQVEYLETKLCVFCSFCCRGYVHM